MANKSTVTWKDRKHHLWWPLSFQKYELRNGRLYQTIGLFSTSIDEVLLYRITDIQLTRTLGQKIFGTGTITLFIKGDSDKELSLVNIKHPKRVRELLSREVENARMQYNVVGREFYGGCTHIDGPHMD
jgi:tRNA1(Val) A37 N6-methylase TrmN6